MGDQRPRWDDRHAARSRDTRDRPRERLKLSVESARAAWRHLRGAGLLDDEGFMTDVLRPR